MAIWSGIQSAVNRKSFTTTHSAIETNSRIWKSPFLTEWEYMK